MTAYGLMGVSTELPHYDESSSELHCGSFEELGKRLRYDTSPSWRISRSAVQVTVRIDGRNQAGLPEVVIHQAGQ